MKKLLTTAILAVLLYADPALAYKLATGRYTGNIADDRTIDISDWSNPTVADFQPDAVVVKCDSANHAMFRNSSMGSSEALQMAVGNVTMISNTIQSFTTNGFVVGSDARANASGASCYFVAWGYDANNDMAVGTYVGDGTTDARPIDISATSVGSVPDFQPEWCAIFEQSAGTANDGSWRSSNFAANSSANFSASAFDANAIESFDANGIVVGTSGLVNELDSNYFYICTKQVSASFSKSGNYTGNGTSQSFTSFTFQPQVIFVKGNSATTATAIKIPSMTTDVRCRTDATTCSTGGATIDADGFSVGSSTAVNESSVVMQYYAFRAPSYAGATARHVGPIHFP